MRTVPVKTFAPRIKPLVSDCPDFAIRRAVVDTVIQMCKETAPLTTEVFFKTIAGEPVYSIPMPDGLDAELVRYAYCEGWDMRPMTLDQLSRYYYPIDYRDQRGQPQFYVFQKRNLLTLSPTPEKTYHIKLVVSVTLARDAENIPNIFFDDYVDTVVDGALSRIYKQAGQSWSNFQLAAEYERRFIEGLAQVREDTARDYTRTLGHVVYNRWIN